MNRVAADSILMAAWGACLGWLLACGVVLLARAHVIPIPALLSSVYAPKGLEKIFFLSFYILGPISAFSLTYFARRTFGNGFAAAVALLVFVVTAPQLATAVIDGGPIALTLALPPLDPSRWETFSRHVIPLIYWIAVPPFALFAAAYAGRFANKSTGPGDLEARPESSLSVWDAAWICACAALIAACVFPLDLGTVAARIGYNVHDVSFYIAPAMYLWGRHLIPGIDFLPQYGLGIGYFFSFFLRPTAEATISNAVLVTVGLCWIYFVSALWLLRRLYDSRLYAAIVVFFALLLTFHTSMVPLGIFLDPSAWPARYPFLLLFVLAFARSVESRRQTIDLTLAGMVAGLCLFWNTETGLYALAAALVATILLRGGLKSTLVHLAATAGGALFAFFGLSAIAYGPGVFQTAFVTGLIKPMTIYAEGYGAFMVVWQSPYNILYAMLSPIVGLATMGWTAALLLRNDTRFTRPTLIVLFLLSMIGSGLLLKWVNMSLDSLWHVNALPLIAVMAWWIQVGLRYLSTRFSARNTSLARGALAVALILFLAIVQDARNPSHYALRAFLLYPSIAVGAVLPQPHLNWDASREAARADVALIRRCSAPQEPVMIVGDSDWVDLLAAKRPPRMPWLPSPTIVAFPFLLESAMRDRGPIFVQGDLATTKYPEPLDTDLREHLASGYRPGPTGTTLKLYVPTQGPLNSSPAYSC